MRTNALDRFGTPIEHRFSRAKIEEMLCDAGLEDMRFSDAPPFWCRGKSERKSEVNGLRIWGKILHERMIQRMRRPRPALDTLSLLRTAAFSFAFMSGQAASAETKLHYAPNHNFAPDGSFLPAGAGFNLADVSGLREIGQLKPGDRALVWVGRCGGVDRDFLRIVRAYAGSRNLFGFFLMDDPDPRPLAGAKNPSHACSIGNLRAEADWIHDNVPGAKTIIVLMNMASTLQPSFKETYEPSDSHVDLFGLAAYPCRSDLSSCDYDIIDRYVAAAVDAGISRDRIVPIYQTFGGGGWATDTGGHYVMPTVRQAADILSRWHQLVPNPEMDMAYSWGTQNNDSALETAPDLQALFARYNRSGRVD